MNVYGRVAGVIAAARTALLANPFALASILSGMLWATCLLAPGDTLLRPTYRHMREVADEEVWTALFLGVAVLQFWRIFARATRRSFPFEVALKLAAMVLWWFVAVACLISQWPLAAAMSDTLVVAVFATIDFARLRPCTNCPSAGFCEEGCPYGR